MKVLNKMQKELIKTKEFKDVWEKYRKQTEQPQIILGMKNRKLYIKNYNELMENCDEL